MLVDASKVSCGGDTSWLSSGLARDELGPPTELLALARDLSACKSVQRAVEHVSAVCISEYVTPAMLDTAMHPGQSLVEVLRGLRIKGQTESDRK